VLVQNESGTVVQIQPSKLPVAERTAALEWGQKVTTQSRLPKAERQKVDVPPIATAALDRQFSQLADVLHMKKSAIQKTVVQQLSRVPYAPIRLKVGVRQDVRNWIAERSLQFPAVEVAQVYLRQYPRGDLAAQILGTVGAISPTQVKSKSYKGVPRDSVIGQAGLESQYDQYLRGVAGQTRVVVDSAGRPKSSRVQTPAIAGRTIKTSIDSGLQQAGQNALSQYVVGPSYAGAFVAMDPRNGQILAMGSAPTFKPSDFTRPISQQAYEQKYGKQSGSPLTDRAITSLYPTGSIFKPITALAGLGSGTLTPATTIDDEGCITIGHDQNKKCNAGKAANGPVDLQNAIRVSSDVYFYLLAEKLNDLKGQVLQVEAKKLGLGHTTGIDVPGEAGGLIPDAAWRRKVKQEELDCEKKEHKSSCGISDKRDWTTGDEANLAVGQGDVQATPLQMATAYAALANGGTVVRPHVGLDVETQQGQIDQRLGTAPTRKVKFPEGYQTILNGLHDATSQSGGTSEEVFSDWPQDKFPLYGKTGTAQRGFNSDGSERNDQSWYAAFVKNPTSGTPIVIVATMEDGGFGAQAAAPAVCEMLRHWYHAKASCNVGSSKTL
jgi:penicillin-binding protein 2